MYFSNGFNVITLIVSRNLHSFCKPGIEVIGSSIIYLQFECISSFPKSLSSWTAFQARLYRYLADSIHFTCRKVIISLIYALTFWVAAKMQANTDYWLCFDHALSFFA